MPNRPNEPQINDIINFFNHILGAPEQSEAHETSGFALHTPFGVISMEVVDYDLVISVNDVRTVQFVIDPNNETILVKVYNHKAPSDKHEYEQLIELGSGENSDEPNFLKQFIQQLQDAHKFITLDVATNNNKDAIILVKSLDDMVGKDSFQIWYIPNQGSVEKVVYKEAIHTESKSTLASGLDTFSLTCHKMAYHIFE